MSGVNRSPAVFPFSSLCRSPFLFLSPPITVRVSLRLFLFSLVSLSHCLSSSVSIPCSLLFSLSHYLSINSVFLLFSLSSPPAPGLSPYLYTFIQLRSVWSVFLARLLGPQACFSFVHFLVSRETKAFLFLWRHHEKADAVQQQYSKSTATAVAKAEAMWLRRRDIL